jgi:beta-ureidopropionase
MLAAGSRDQSTLIVADLDLDGIRQVRHTGQCFRDRRPETYGGLCKP